MPHAYAALAKSTKPELGGHKDFKVKTECPGNRLYPLLDDIRKDTGLRAPPK